MVTRERWTQDVLNLLCDNHQNECLEIIDKIFVKENWDKLKFLYDYECEVEKATELIYKIINETPKT